MVLTRRQFSFAALLAACVVAPAQAQRGLGPRGMVLGFALECVRCESTPPNGRLGRAGRGGLAIWHYSEYPTIAAVAPNSPAHDAGLQVGDLLRSIDGLSLLTDEGGERLRTVSAGDKVRLQLERGGRTIDLNLTLTRPGRLGPPDFARPLDKPADKIDKVRDKLSAKGIDARVPDFPADYTARVGAVALDIWSAAPVIASTDSTGATILTIGGTTIRLRGGRGLGGFPAGFGPGRAGRQGGPP